MIDELAGAPLIGPVEPPALHVMTFNIRRRMTGLAWRRADRWRHRTPAVRALLGQEQPTIAGMQEVLPDQADAALAALGRRYRFIGRGHGRRGTGEGCPLFYDAERLDLLEWEQTALSEYSHEPGSRTWGNLIPRIAVTARFRDRATGRRFAVVNTHLDPFSPRSRLRSADALKAIIGSGPAVLTGDLNAGPGSRTLREMLDGGLCDAWAVAEQRVTASVGTFVNYRAPRPDRARIDWILVTPGIEVERAAINTRVFGGVWPSDHVPVQAVVTLPDDRGRA
ncbi:endonuclease/exonuclease/phosphatase family protein [Microbacterium trichothecenolyticum]|uniref:Endonuclease/exonuclease/phosphatase family protein n=1 Tax=Microbacterium ureisolvens TaxID=2781186 RepID=A0ABS7I203_9MICO|nr:MULTISPECIES: endonuclease/exonuclease/phosphatase family protein [Microbacterium]MBW9111593.1 endonuclease/exonuclease/phosphatase family protein [Microbacterium ureisolvens]MBW9121834.1 endonuclease/exonuclease/phosphatase family protein [Microbacterium trichothecenolyticum]